MHDVHDSRHFINASSTWSGTGREGKGKGGCVVGTFFPFFPSLNPWFDLRSHTLCELVNKRNVPHPPPTFFPSGPPGVSRYGTKHQSFNTYLPVSSNERMGKNSGNPPFFLMGIFKRGEDPELNDLREGLFFHKIWVSEGGGRDRLGSR